MKQYGFTLLEVMIALTVVAVGAAGLISAGGQALREQHMLETRIFASWIAENKITELRSSHAWSNYSVSDEKVTMAGKEWNLHTAISTTPNANMRKIEVAVSDDDLLKSSPVSLISFLGKY